MVLEHAGAEVTSAASVSEALGCLERLTPDAVVSDIGMPGEDGYSLMRRLRSTGAGAIRDLPAVALTAYAQADDRKKALAAGFQVHVSKPIEPLELIEAIRRLIG
jgi:CheY-like chemotaxis protein